MKRFSLIFFLCFFTGWNSFAQSGFEGVIHLSAQNQERKEKATVTWTKKGNKNKIEFQTTTADGSFNYTLLSIDPASDVMLLTEGPEKNIYYKIPQSGFPKSNLVNPGANIRKGEGRKLIAGIECTEYHFYSGENSGVIWVGEIPGFSSVDIPSYMKSNGVLGALQANGISGIPLEFTLYNSGQQILATQTFVGIQPRPVMDSEFNLPAGYEAGN